MGKGVDDIRARRKKQHEEESDQKRERNQQIADKINETVPAIVATIERLGYPERRGPFHYAEFAEIEGQEYVVWDIWHDFEDCPHSLYISAEGHMIIDRKKIVDPVEVGGYMHEKYGVGTRVKDAVIRGLEAMANFKP
jgi:hypothetical protein